MGFSDSIGQVIQGDCLDVMQSMPDECIDTIITDPPYGLKFMGKEWDHGVPGVPFWSEALRVAKPGTMLLAFGGTRTHHRLMVAIEDAGWEIRDCMMWLYGSGFPKSLDISKAIDKRAAAERKIGGMRPIAYPDSGCWSPPNQTDDGTCHNPSSYSQKGNIENGLRSFTSPATDDAKEWDGYGTGLKPAWEPIIVAMKSLDGTFANNAIEHGVAGFNIGGGRVGSNPGYHYNADRNGTTFHGEQGRRIKQTAAKKGCITIESSQGRWPANLVLSHTPECREVGVKKVKGTSSLSSIGQGCGAKSKVYGQAPSIVTSGYADSDGTETVAAWECSPDCPVRLLDEQSGASNDRPAKTILAGEASGDGHKGMFVGSVARTGYQTSGGASRFFYCAKASRSERNAGLPEGRKNRHPTVKPLKLMEYLCKLTMTPTGGIVLDPFAGSGSTLLAAQNVGRPFIGIELEEEHCETARYRLGGTLFSRAATA